MCVRARAVTGRYWGWGQVALALEEPREGHVQFQGWVATRVPRGVPEIVGLGHGRPTASHSPMSLRSSGRQGVGAGASWACLAGCASGATKGQRREEVKVLTRNSLGGQEKDDMQEGLLEAGVEARVWGVWEVRGLCGWSD